MAVFVFAETWEGKFKKASFEAVSYGARVAKAMGTEAIAAVRGWTLGASPLGAAAVIRADGCINMGYRGR